MTKWRFVAMVICLGCIDNAAGAQTTQLPAHSSHKAHARKVVPANDVSEDWSIAEPKKATPRSSDVGQNPNLAEGRKKFFEQSTTMQGGGPASHGNASGFTPSMGLNF